MSEEYIKKVDVLNEINNITDYNEKKINEIKEEMHEMIDDDNKSIEYDNIERDYNNSKLIQQLYDENHALNHFSYIMEGYIDIDLSQQLRQPNIELEKYKQQIRKMLLAYIKKMEDAIEEQKIEIKKDITEEHYGMVECQSNMLEKFGSKLILLKQIKEDFEHIKLDIEAEEKEDDIDFRF